jgi:predicted O-linked N-acetylglucosamine transferase (SPINDLY family)
MASPPDDAVEALLRDANGREDAGDLRGALAQYREAARLAPGNVEILLRLARCAEASGERDIYAAALSDAIQLDDRHPEVLRGYARLCLATHNLGMAERALRRLIEVAPDAPGAHQGLALVLWRAGQGRAAHAAFEEALARDPGDLVSRWILGQQPASPVFVDEAEVAAFRARWRDTLAYFEQLDAHDPEIQAAVESALVTCTDAALHVFGDDFDAEHRRYAALVRRFAQARHPDLAFAPRAARARIRVVFVSRFFHHHSVMKAFEGLVCGLDTTRFEVVLLQLGEARDRVTERMATYAFAHVAAEAPAAWWRERILAAQADVLVYPDIGLEGTAQWLAAQRLAPVQCVLWGHPIATGFSSIDHFLSADAVERADAEIDYSENLVRLPGLGASYAPPDLRGNPTFAFPRGASAMPVRCLVAQRAQKLTPRHDRLHARIAAAVPEAEFFYAPDPDPAVCVELDARLQRSFAAAGVDPRGRLHVLPELAYGDFLALAQGCDLNLDSVGFSGGITSMELLSMGLPTVTLPGLRMRSRQTAAMLRLLDAPELIAEDEDGYVAIAVDLARESQRRLALRQRILAHRSRLHDGAAVEAAFARFLESAWSRHAIPTH